MTKILTNVQNYVNIAENIRNITTTNQKYKPSEIPDGIQSVWLVGYNEGEMNWKEFFNTVTSFHRWFQNGNNNLFNLLNLKSEYTKNATDFSYMFYNNTALISLPDLNTQNGTNFSHMFFNCTRLRGALQINYNLSNATDFSYMFYNCSKIISVSFATECSPTYMQNSFSYCAKLTTILKLNLSKATGVTDIFRGTNALKNITFEGTINITFSPNQNNTATFSKATVESMINALSPTAAGKTLTLRTANKTSNFTDEEWETLIATKPNWTFSLI